MNARDLHPGDKPVHILSLGAGVQSSTLDSDGYGLVEYDREAERWNLLRPEASHLMRSV